VAIGKVFNFEDDVDLVLYGAESVDVLLLTPMNPTSATAGCSDAHSSRRILLRGGGG
jgi:hypothetical protein